MTGTDRLFDLRTRRSPTATSHNDSQDILSLSNQLPKTRPTEVVSHSLLDPRSDMEQILGSYTARGAATREEALGIFARYSGITREKHVDTDVEYTPDHSGTWPPPLSIHLPWKSCSFIVSSLFSDLLRVPFLILRLQGMHCMTTSKKSTLSNSTPPEPKPDTFRNDERPKRLETSQTKQYHGEEMATDLQARKRFELGQGRKKTASVSGS